jgi:secreted PhoX family phosphatase
LGRPGAGGRARVQPLLPECQGAVGQFGYNCDYIGVLPIDGNDDHCTLVANHEYTNPELMFPEDRYTTAQKARIEMAAHGMSVVEIKRGSHPGSWRRVALSRAERNRRITANTPFRLTGPAAGHALLKTTADPTGRNPLGTLNNCAGGMTPWGTVLSGEENFNQYFDASGPLDPTYAESYARYGITGVDTRGWSEVDRRFDLTQEPHEPFRFGWVVEVDPSNPKSTPRKRTMLGRFKHEGANIAISKDGHAVAYMGDDERGDYIYKFVSRLRFWSGKGARAKAHNMALLDDGTLYVAKLTGDGTDDGQFDGTGEWLKLCTAKRSFVPGMSVAEVLIHTRLAADKLAPTRMDRPEDIEPNPVNGRIYCALTNNSKRGKTPRCRSTRRTRWTPRWSVRSSARRSPPRLATATATSWRSPRPAPTTPPPRSGGSVPGLRRPEAAETYFGGYPKDRVSPISCPDNVAFDPAGHLWVATDGNQLGSNDGLFAVPTAGANRGQVLQFLTVPVGAECCGPLITEDGNTVFVAVQHPGEDGSSRTRSRPGRTTTASPARRWSRPTGSTSARSVADSEPAARRRRRHVGGASAVLRYGEPQSSRQEPSSRRAVRGHLHESSVHHVRRPRDVGGARRGQERDHRGDLVDVSGPTGRVARALAAERLDSSCPVISVAISPGATELTVMPCSASSRASTLVSMPRPALAAQ